MAFVAFIGGLRRVAAAPPLLLGAYGVALAVVLGMQLVPGGVGAAQPGPVAAAGALVGIPHTFGPGLVGFAAVLSTLDNPYGMRAPLGAATGMAVAGVAAWTFLAGGILDRLARQRRTAGPAFFAACRHHFWPLARLAALAGAMYWFLLGGLFPWLLGDPFSAPARLPTVPADAARSALHLMLGAGVAGVGLLVDYARVRAVVEDRRSMVGALVAALRFVRRRPAAVIGLWLMNAALAAATLAAWTLAAPGAGAVDPAMRAAFLGGQLCIAAQLFAQLVAWASQTAYFQDQLAHATYVARARVSPPEPIADRPV